MHHYVPSPLFVFVYFFPTKPYKINIIIFTFTVKKWMFREVRTLIQDQAVDNWIWGLGHSLPVGPKIVAEPQKQWFPH